MKTDSNTPEQRKRLLLPRQPIFTVSMSGGEIQRQFRFRQSLAFTSAAALGILGMWVVAFSKGIPSLSFRWPALFLSILFFCINSLSRLRQGFVQATSFLAGFLFLGFFVGTFVSTDHRVLFTLFNPTLLVLLTLLGSTFNLIFIKRDRTPTVRFLWNGPWLAVACIAAYFFPAGEWTLLLSGLTAILLLFILESAGTRTLTLYQPKQPFLAASDILPLVFLSIYRSFTGK
jgi:hypothetical protein